MRYAINGLLSLTCDGNPILGESSATRNCPGPAPTTSISRCDGSSAYGFHEIDGRALASLRARRARQVFVTERWWSSRTTSTSRSGRSASASPVAAGHPRTAIG